MIIATTYGLGAYLLFVGLPALAGICGAASLVFAFRQNRNFALCLLGSLFSAGIGGLFCNILSWRRPDVFEFLVFWTPLLIGIFGLIAIGLKSRRIK